MGKTYILFFLLTFCKGQNPKLTDQECLQSHLHNIKLLKKSQMDKTQKEEILKNLTNKNFTKMIIETCKNEKNRKQIECELNSQEFIDLKNCHKFIKR